ncbi:hypothetical protein [Sandaracinobacteroides hominis]|uniref:hypothetical protein n=1 Tax=Sandaracinobacteroides hominis TaxID=2780086 RepID=UPI0018F34E82|nr:hypothetical protein [Sandaracinobacteroides hominis]
MRWGLFAGFLMAGASAQAQGVPEPIKARVNELVAQCAAAGGTLGNMSGQGQFVIPRDFTGDGRTDFLVSEGNFPCVGKPTLFRPNGLARLELWVGTPGNASLAFQDRVIAYRVLDGKPAKLQIARRGTGCGPGAKDTVRCGDELRWSGSRFEEVATDGRNIAPRAAAGAAAPVAAAAPLAAVAAGNAGPAPAALPMAANAKASFTAQCRKEILADDPRNAKWVDGHCAEMWTRVVTAGPAADALLNAIPASPGISLAEAKARMTGVRWGRTQPPSLASGKLGQLDVNIDGKGMPQSASAGWMAVGQPTPYDVPGAMMARGAKLTLMSCEKMGVGEGQKLWAGSAPGRAPFTLTVDSREAPTASANSFYSASVSLDGRTPRKGSLAQCREF